MNEIYCGPAPDPASLAFAWRLDAAALLLVGCLLALKFSRGERPDRAFLLGCAIFLLLFLSPLCALSAALFSARVVHHLLLVTVVAPLLVCRAWSPSRPGRNALFAWTCVFTVVFWLWHVPALYEVAVTNAAVYWLMQTSLLVSAGLMWHAIFHTLDRSLALVALLSNVIQMGMLGALLTFSGAPIYGPHLLTTQAFGLSALEDQQLAGLIMWVPGAVPFLVAGLVLVGRMLTPRAGRLDRAARS